MQFVKCTTVLDFGRNAAHCAARIRAELERKGTPIGPFDTLIAGTAVSNQATLVTRNTREFRRIEGLAMEDWY
jgi:tRNA(fMet)-specific endonuclease VapC